MTTMNRRELMIGIAALAGVSVLPRGAFATYAPMPEGWKSFQLTTKVVLPRDGKAAQAWVPVPHLADPLWARPGDVTFTTTGTAELVVDAAQGVAYVHATWPEGETPAELEVVAQVAVQSRHVDLTVTGATLDEAERARHLRATDLLPLDGIVLETATAITKDASTDVEKARAIFDWVVEQTERNPETRGCGLGDIASMLSTGDLTGKCADLNALYVGLARAAGLPARDLYGLRVAPSAFGYKSLGAGSEVVTKAQHCRAEVFLEGIGWVPADPADVRKVVLEEPPKTLTLADAAVQDVRAALFGSSEGNWVCLNDAHDVTLQGTDRTLPFLMYPQAEIAGKAQDELDAATFVYEITAQAV